MIQSVNFPIAPYCAASYGGWEALEKRLKKLGLDGVEGIWDPYEPDESFPKSLLTGYHLVFYPDWLDFYRQDEKALLEKFGSLAMVEKIYGGARPEALMAKFKDDLKRAAAFEADYVVFHVSDVSIEENFTYRWRHTNGEVLSGAVAFINEMLKDAPPTFDFLVENQWWPGFTFTEPGETEYLLSHIDFPRVGIMLDTGHLMNANMAIRNQAQGVAYIKKMYEAHGELGKRVLGLHFHQSVSGAYVRRHTGRLPDGFPTDYFEAFFRTYPHIQLIDRHLPWTEPKCAQIIDEIEPLYLTHELSRTEKRPKLASVKRQLTAIRKGHERFA
ncbi:MAG: TIM barrel protein [Oscillospiraceae bacterium]|nr:TIM barrel protein [Oscillospiraceae bacterium]